MQVALEGVGQWLVAGGGMVWVLDKVHAAFVRHKTMRKELEKKALTANLVTADQCKEHRESCQGRMDCRLEDGDRYFDLQQAYIRVMARKLGITAQEIDEEMALLRRDRRTDRA